MLMVTDMLKTALGMTPVNAVRKAAPLRFEKSKNAPAVVVWNICRHCNMTCPHCYAAAITQPARDDLSTEEGLALIDALAESGVRVVIFSGGEPLLRSDLFTLIERARDRGLGTNLSSNGVLIDRAIAERLKTLGVSYVGVSLDGLSEFNDAYRGYADGFHRALEGIDHVKSVGIRAGIRITLTRRNRDQLRPVFEVAMAHQVDRFYVSHLVYAGRGYRLIKEDLNPEASREVLEEVFELAVRHLDDEASPKIVTGSNDSDGPFLLCWVERRYGANAAQRIRTLLEARGGNSAGESLLAIDPRGRVHPDQFWQAETIGNIRETAWSTILEHPLRSLLRRRESLLQGRCELCAYRALCRGSHRERAIARFHTLWAPDPACVLSDEEIGIQSMESRRIA